MPVRGVSRSALEAYLACPYSFLRYARPELARLFRAPSKPRRVSNASAPREGLRLQAEIARLLKDGGICSTLLSPDAGPAAKAAAAICSATGRPRRVYERSVAWLTGYGGTGLPDIIVETGDGWWVVEVKRGGLTGWRLRLQLEWYLYAARNGVVFVKDDGSWVPLDRSGFRGVLLVKVTPGGGVRLERLRAGEDPRLVTRGNLEALLAAKKLAEDYVAYDTGVRLKECARCPFRTLCRLVREKGLVETRRVEPPTPLGVMIARELTDYHGVEEQELAGIPAGDETRRVAEAVEEMARRCYTCDEMEAVHGVLLKGRERIRYEYEATRRHVTR